MTKKKKCVMRTISAFSFVCVIVRTMSREKQCQIQEYKKKQKKDGITYRKRYFGTRSHGVVAKCNTSTFRKDVYARALALFRFRHKLSKNFAESEVSSTLPIVGQR